MFIKVETDDSTDTNVNVSSIRSFSPNPRTDGSMIQFNDGTTMLVKNSTRSLRGYIKKALFAMHTGGAEPGEG